jgi:hypothetical protein
MGSREAAVGRRATRRRKTDRRWRLLLSLESERSVTTGVGPGPLGQTGWKKSWANQNGLGHGGGGGGFY